MDYTIEFQKTASKLYKTLDDSGQDFAQKDARFRGIDDSQKPTLAMVLIEMRDQHEGEAFNLCEIRARASKEYRDLIKALAVARQDKLIAWHRLEMARVAIDLFRSKYSLKKEQMRND